MSPSPRQLQGIMDSNQASGREGIATAIERKAGKREASVAMCLEDTGPYST